MTTETKICHGDKMTDLRAVSMKSVPYSRPTGKPMGWQHRKQPRRSQTRLER